MAQDPQARVVQQVTTPQIVAAPSVREMRAQAVHRLQVGLFGLCAMLLLVGLANIIMDRARLAEEDDPAVLAPMPSEVPKKTSDPLADIGVVPAADPSAAADEGN